MVGWGRGQAQDLGFTSDMSSDSNIAAIRGGGDLYIAASSAGTRGSGGQLYVLRLSKLSFDDEELIATLYY